VMLLHGLVATKSKLLKKAKSFLAKLLGLKKPKAKSNVADHIAPIPRQFVSIHILGDRKDIRDAYGNEKL